MTALIIDGKAVAAQLRAGLGAHVAQVKAAHNLVPGLAVVLVGENPASQIYVAAKHRAVAAAGMQNFEYKLPKSASQDDVLSLVRQLNDDSAVHGILVQLPLPPQIDAKAVIDTIDPLKDVDGFHVLNAGRLALGLPAMIPCTPKGCLYLLKNHLQLPLAGLRALIIGRSNIVGKPMAQLLLNEDCTVIQAHSKTRDLVAECRQADIVIAAIGKPEMIKGDWIKDGAIVIDVGINRVNDNSAKGYHLLGDVEYAAAAQRASAITPVPGGVGPMTIACLLDNTLKATCLQANIARPQ